MLRPVGVPGDGAGMVQSECLWIGNKGGRSDVIELSWEVMAEPSEGIRGQLGVSEEQFGACRLTHPVTGTQLPLFTEASWNSTMLQTGTGGWMPPAPSGPRATPWEPIDPASDQVLSLSEGLEERQCADRDCRLADFFLQGTLVSTDLLQADADGTCIDGTEAVVATEIPRFRTTDPSAINPVLFDAEVLPNCSPAGACGVGCRFSPSADCVVQIEPADVFVGGSPAPWPNGSYAADPFPTRLMVVDDTRTIVRELEPASGSRWMWQTPVVTNDNGESRWEENFTGNVRVSKARLFERLPDGSERPLAVNGAELQVVGPGARRPSLLSESCPTSDDGTGHVVDLLDCAQEQATPTAWLPALGGGATDGPIRWSIRLDEPPDHRAMIAFELEALGNISSLVADPAVADFDDTEQGADRQFWVTVYSAGDRDIMVEDVRVTGADADVFAIRIPDGPVVPSGASSHPIAAAPAPSDRAVPFRVGRDGAFSVLVTARPHGGEAYDAALEVHTRDDFAQLDVIKTVLRVQGLAVSFEAFPASTVWSVARGSGWSTPRTMFLVNSGHVDIEREAYQVVGDDAHHFTVADPTHDWHVVWPGDAEPIEVEFTPTCAPPFPLAFDGLRHAELVVPTNRGTIRWSLAGSDGTIFVCQAPE